MESAIKTPRISCLIALGVLFITLASHHQPADGTLGELEKLFFNFFPEVTHGSPDEKLFFVDWILQDVVPIFIGQQGNNENGSKWEYKEYAYLDESNDDAIRLNGQELITRSGYKFETYDALADDGYVTILTRIINPLADPKKLRQPPVLMEHGGTIDPTAYIIASSIQHHPEKWPRKPEDGPITSWNRSLAFVLANNGFDVWLAETRGANEHNTRHQKSKSAFTSLKNVEKNMTFGETIDQLMRQWTYYSFSMDDIIAHELKSHMDMVFKVTGAKKLHLFSFSLSTPTTLGFLSIRPDYAEKVEGYVSMAPIISGQGVNILVKIVLQHICPLLPDRNGGIHITDIVMSQPMRELLIFWSGSKYLRYGAIKASIAYLLGPSPKYGTNLELNVLGHMLRHLSFRMVKQMCQQTSSDKLQKYDYGPIKNKLLYNSEKPPIYDLSNLKLKEWIIVAGANDKLATLEVMNNLVELVNPKPVAKIVVPEFNHLDLMAGFENDIYVNMPILKYLQDMSDRYEHGYDLEAAGARNFDLKSLLPPAVQPEKLQETAGEISKSLTNFTTMFNIDSNFFPIPKDLFNLIQGLGSHLLGRSASRKDSEEHKTTK